MKFKATLKIKPGTSAAVRCRSRGTTLCCPAGAERSRFHPIASPRGNNQEETTMKVRTIALAAAFALSSTLAFAQAGNTAGGDSKAGGPAASKTTTGDSMDGRTTGGGGTAMKNGATPTTTGTSMPSAKDASTQGAGTAGAAEKKGDATAPGGTMKK
jgi:hypothetical protein